MSFLDNILYRKIKQSFVVELPVDTNELRSALTDEFKTSPLGFTLDKKHEQRYTGSWISATKFKLKTIQQIVTGKGLLQMLSYEGEILEEGTNTLIEVKVGPSILLRVFLYIVLASMFAVPAIFPISKSFMKVAEEYPTWLWFVASIATLGFWLVCGVLINNFLASFQNKSQRAQQIIPLELKAMVKRRR